MINTTPQCSNITQYNSFFLKDIQSICQPLFQTFPVTHLLYKRVFQDGHYFLLSSDHQCTQNFVEHIENKGEILFEDVWPVDQQVYKYLWSREEHCLSASGLKVFQSLGITYGLNMIRRREDKSIENVVLATQYLERDLDHFYLNHLDILNRFVFYFKHKACKIIEDPMTKKLAYSSFYHSEMQQLDQKNSQEKNTQLISSHAFVEQTKITKYLMKDVKGREITLSRMQIQCLYQLSRGKTAKEIARYFGISPRTVQTHLNFVKEKLGN